MNKYNILLTLFLSILFLFFLRFGMWVSKSKNNGSKGNWTYSQKHKILSRLDDTLTKTFEKLCPNKVVCEKNCFIDNVISNNSYAHVDKNGVDNKQTQDILDKCTDDCKCDL